MTIQNIAERIGISQAAIYRHFKDKHHIVDDLTDLAFLPPVTVSPSSGTCNPLDRLYSIVSRQVQELEKNPYLTAIAFQEEIFHEYPDVRAKFIRNGGQMEQAIAAIVKCGQNKGVFLTSVDPQAFAVIYVGSIRLAVQKWRNSDFGYSLMVESQKIVGELFKLLKGSGYAFGD